MLLSRSPLLIAGTLTALALIAGPGCKKKPPEPPPPPPPTVEVRLQVSSVQPSSVEPEQTAAGKVFGSAFVNGATVTFSNSAVSRAGAEVRVADANTINLTIPALPEGTYDVVVANPDGEQSTLRSGLTVRRREIACRQETVYFPFDVHALSSGARSTLDGHLGCWQGLTGSIKIEGHADERGTVDYNLALGQRRADSVRRHIVGGGVTTGRVTTLSYGEERPASSGHDESAWSKNRRAEINASE